MPRKLTRRHCIQAGGTVSLASLLPRAVFSQGTGARKAVIRADREVGVIRPELHFPPCPSRRLQSKLPDQSEVQKCWMILRSL